MYVMGVASETERRCCERDNHSDITGGGKTVHLRRLFGPGNGSPSATNVVLVVVVLLFWVVVNGF